MGFASISLPCPYFLAVIAVLMGIALIDSSKERVVVHPDRDLGGFKDFRGVNCGPLSPRGWDSSSLLDLSEFYARMGVRVIRFHDLWVADELDTIFPDANADPADLKSYNFALLDRHVEKALGVANLLILRVGYDIHRTPKNKPHVSMDKLVEVSKRIALHYTKGWADGYYYKNIWFEIWNEPDIEMFWALSEEEYFALYEKVAKAIKSIDLELKVGGPAIAYRIDFLDRFLDYARSQGAPVDFVTWHVYSTKPGDLAAKAQGVHEVMVKHGYGSAPSILDEWNYGDWQNPEPFEVFDTSKVAVFQMAAALLMEDAPVDMAALYRGDASVFGGLFRADGKPRKAFYAWLAYRELIEGKRRMAVEVAGRNLLASASKGEDGSVRLLVVNYSKERIAYELAVEGYKIDNVLAVDDQHELEPVEACTGSTCTIEPHAMQLALLRESKQS